MSTSDIATVTVQTSRDGSWIGNASYPPASTTIAEAGPDPDLVIRRLAAHLDNLKQRPSRVKLVRVKPDGTREERELALAELRSA